MSQYESMELGSAPYDVHPAQVGQDGYSDKARKECLAFKNQLLRILQKKTENLPENFSLLVKGFSHDFGTYYEVVCKFKVDNDESWNLYDFLDENIPANWDEEAMKELNITSVEAE